MWNSFEISILLMIFQMEIIPFQLHKLTDGRTDRQTVALTLYGNWLSVGVNYKLYAFTPIFIIFVVVDGAACLPSRLLGPFLMVYHSKCIFYTVTNLQTNIRTQAIWCSGGYNHVWAGGGGRWVLQYDGVQSLEYPRCISALCVQCIGLEQLVPPGTVIVPLLVR